MFVLNLADVLDANNHSEPVWYVGDPRREKQLERPDSCSSAEK